jgi:dienelactone hydrolase
VLGGQIDGQPANQMVSRYLRAEADAALERRRQNLESLKTPEQLAEYQRRLKEFFIEQLGGFPERTPLNAQVVGRIPGDGFRVEKVIFESRPKHHVTAIVFLPDGDERATPKPPWPAVLVPCGHSANGKASSSNQLACILLARNGIAAMCYDPIGQGERYQLLDDAGKPKHRSTSEHTIVGAHSMLVARNTASYRVWDGLRAIDYLCERKDVDPARIGCTGCSGGGTLTSYLMSLDERIACAAPSCYITSFERLLATIGPQDAEQNIHGQIGFGMNHGDYILMRGPRPTLLCASTRDFFDIEGTWQSFREAKRFYTRLGYPERVSLLEADASHGYPQLHREGMARWMSRWLLARDEPIAESDAEAFSDAELQCTPDGQVMLIEGEASVFDFNRAEAERLRVQREAFWKEHSTDEARAATRKLSGARPLADIGADVKRLGTIDRQGYKIEKLTITPEAGIVLPALLFTPTVVDESLPPVLYVHGEGKHVDAAAGGAIEKLAKSGHTVLAIDQRGTGETGEGSRFKDIFTAYLLGRSMVGMQTDDVLAAAKALQEMTGSRPQLVAIGAACSPALHAAALESKPFGRVRLIGAPSSWSAQLAEPETPGMLAGAVHGALAVYDTAELLRVLRDENIELEIVETD